MDAAIICSSVACQPYIFPHRAVKESGLPRHIANLVPPPAYIQILDGNAINQDLTQAGVVGRSSSFAIVLLPEPLGPTSATDVPGSIES
jgi:hypothetical protein